MLALGLDEGRLIFIVKGMGKNYGWIEEYTVYKKDDLAIKFWEDVAGFSKCFLDKKQPPLEPLLDEKGRVNWRIRYSKYYDLLYKEQVDEHLEMLEAETEDHKNEHFRK